MHLLEDFRAESLQESVNGGAIYEDCDGLDPCTVTSSKNHHYDTLTSILKSSRRKRRLTDEIDDNADKGMPSFLESVSILTPNLLPSKRRRRSTELRDVHHDDTFLGDTECQKHVSKTKRVAKKIPKQKTARKITKEDIFAFIHNIRLDGTRAEQLSSLMTAKCLLAAG